MENPGLRRVEDDAGQSVVRRSKDVGEAAVRREGEASVGEANGASAVNRRLHRVLGRLLQLLGADNASSKKLCFLL